MRRTAVVTGTRLLVAGSMAAVALGFLALTGRPEAWSGGMRFVAGTVLAIGGTAAGAVGLAAALLGGLLVQRELERSGVLSACAGLGYGPRELLRAFGPALVLAVVVVGSAVFVVEPAAWTAVHAVKGSPAATAIALARLDRGEVIPLAGGAAVRRDGTIRLTLGATRGRLRELAPEGAGWSLAQLEVDGPTASWSADRMQLVPMVAPEAPRSPLTRGWSALREQGRSTGSLGRRARHVMHRRLALSLLAPLLACLGFGFGGRRRVRAGWGGAACVVGLFLLMRGMDRLAALELLPPLVTGWSPTLAALVFLVVVRMRRTSA